jgi:hypothetical protein
MTEIKQALRCYDWFHHMTLGLTYEHYYNSDVAFSNHVICVTNDSKHWSHTRYGKEIASGDDADSLIAHLMEIK